MISRFVKLDSIRVVPTPRQASPNSPPGLRGLALAHLLRVHGVRRRANLLLAAVATQFLLGVLTVLRLPAQPVFWGATHQAGAVALLVATILGLHAVTRDTVTPVHR